MPIKQTVNPILNIDKQVIKPKFSKYINKSSIKDNYDNNKHLIKSFSSNEINMHEDLKYSPKNTSPEIEEFLKLEHDVS